MDNKDFIKQELHNKGVEVRSITDEFDRLFKTAESRGFCGALAEQYVAQQLYFLNERLKIEVI